MVSYSCPLESLESKALWGGWMTQPIKVWVERKRQKRKVVEPAPAYEGRAREVLIPGK